MRKLLLLSKAQMPRLKPYILLAHGVPRVDDRWVMSGIVYANRIGLHWKDAPKRYLPQKMLYNKFIRWRRLGVFDRNLATTAAEGPSLERIMIDIAHLKAHRKAANQLKNGMFPGVSAAPRVV